VEQDREAAAIWTGFQELLQAMIPASLGYRRLRIRNPDVVVETESGDFILDEVSGGLSAIIEMTWQIFLQTRNEGHHVIVMDEPENHLHPSMQREIIPGLLRSFPASQFVVATHSPHVVTVVQDSAVYVLDYDRSKVRRVVSRLLDYTN